MSIHSFDIPKLQLRLKNRAASLVDIKPVDRLPPLSSSRIKQSSKTHLPLPPVTTRSIHQTKSKLSKRSYGPVKAFAACTNQGIVRSYNEDRVTIMPKVEINKEKEIVSYFGLFDGHGGSTCADFLAENLHRSIFRQISDKTDIKESLKTGYSQTDNTLLINSLQKSSDNSGSCCLSAIVDDKHIHIANVGDSRALLGTGKGKVSQITQDHKPGFEPEKKRIEKAGGSIFFGNNLSVARLVPGRLSVSRSFGDVAAKMKHLGGNPNVLIAVPDIYRIKVHEGIDYLFMASDGIFDVLSNEDVNSVIWQCLRSPGELSFRLAEAGNRVIDLALERQTTDNVTCILIGF